MTAAATVRAPAATVHRPVEGGLVLEVADVRDETASVVCITFRDPAGAPLPRYVPGSHLVVHYGDGANAYSLTGSGSAPAEYTISVLRVENGAGGSRAMHRLTAGDRVRVSLPAAHLRRWRRPPITSWWRQESESRRCSRTHGQPQKRAWRRRCSTVHRPGAGAHAAETRELLGSAFTECTNSSDFRHELRKLLTSQRLGTHLYVCGPAAFMDSVLGQAMEYGWPKSRLHSESFGAAELDQGQPFTARLSRSGVTLQVPAGVSLLESLERAGKSIPNMCRKGVCGECSLSVLRGAPQHRDLYLSDDEKSANTTIMCCVSRSLDEELELDL